MLHNTVGTLIESTIKKTALSRNTFMTSNKSDKYKSRKKDYKIFFCIHIHAYYALVKTEINNDIPQARPATQTNNLIISK